MNRVLYLSFFITAVAVCPVYGIGPSIQRVELIRDAATPKGSSYALTRRKLPKFVGRELTSGNERFDVYWQPPIGGLEAGAEMVVEYQRQFSDRTMTKTQRFPLPVQTARKSSFQLDDREARDDGPIAAWRVRLTSGGRLLAEKTSDTWK